MAPRPYRMDRRAEHADETRQRIVRATYALHAEKGIAATSVRDIAERADVAVGTVYHHFATYDDVIEACGAYTVEQTRPPGHAIFDGVESPGARLETLAEALFAYYRRFPGYERARADRDKFARLEQYFCADEDNRRALIAAAVHPRRVPKERLGMAFALLDVSVYRALVQSGLAQADAARSVAGLLEHLLLALEPAAGASRTARHRAPRRTNSESKPRKDHR